MSWYKQHSSFSNPFNKSIADRCINCGQIKEVKTTITMEFGEGNFNTGPCCKDCYQVNHRPGTIQV